MSNYNFSFILSNSWPLVNSVHLWVIWHFLNNIDISLSMLFYSWCSFWYECFSLFLSVIQPASRRTRIKIHIYGSKACLLHWAMTFIQLAHIYTWMCIVYKYTNILYREYICIHFEYIYIYFQCVYFATNIQLSLRYNYQHLSKDTYIIGVYKIW
jgi:hypothetical protein